MPRPHEDRPRHTLVDHRPGGSRISFAAGAWCAVDVARVRAERADAAVSAYETLIERFEAASAPRAGSAILRSTNGRRVVTIVEVRGHADFRRLAAAWDDHHLYAEHRANAESVSLGLYRVADVAGDARIDAASADRYEFETIAQPPSRLSALLEPLALSPGFRGALILASDDDKTSVVVYRFEHEAEFDAFRGSTPALAHLGPAGSSGERLFPMRAVKTFGPSA